MSYCIDNYQLLAGFQRKREEDIKMRHSIFLSNESKIKNFTEKGDELVNINRLSLY